MKTGKPSAKGALGLRYIWGAISQPLIATVFGLLVGAVVIALTGKNPLDIYFQMFSKSFFTPYYLLQTLTRSTPIIICAMATAMAWRAGYINIGVEGQMVIGGFVAAVCALYIPGPPIVVILISIALAVVAGGLYASICAVLDDKFGVSIVICSLMLNYVANNVTSYFVAYPLKDPGGDGIAQQTLQIAQSLRFWKLPGKSTFNLSFFIAIAITILLIVFSRYTTTGYESKMGGFNPQFARYGGINQRRMLYITLALSGAIAAMAGAGEVFGVKYRYIDSMFSGPSYAWTGLMAALIADLNPIGMFVVSIFLSGLQVGGLAIQRTSGIPLEMATIIQCCITLFVSVKLTVRYIRKKKSTEAQEIVAGGAEQ